MHITKIIASALLAAVCSFSFLPITQAEIINVTETATSKQTNGATKECVATLASIQVLKVATIYVESLANTYDSILPEALVNTTAAVLIKDKITVETKEEKPEGAAKQLTATATVDIDTDQIPELMESLQDNSAYTTPYNAILNRYKKLHEESAALDEPADGKAKDELKKARKDLAKALKAVTYIEKGLQAQNDKDLDKAISLYNKAVRMNNQDDLAYCLRGDAHEALGEHQAALEDYEKALKLSPDEQTYKDKRQDALAKLGNN